MMYHVEYAVKESIMSEYGETQTKKVSKEELVEMLQNPKCYVLIARCED